MQKTFFHNKRGANSQVSLDISSESKLGQNGTPFYITTTLPYVNADPHVGFAMEIIRADVIARWKKSQGYDVFLNTGTDEHGKKLWEGAKNEGKDIQDYLDENAKRFRVLKELLNISDDIHFVRTTDSNHIVAVKEFWVRCKDNGYIYKKTYQAKYCVGCELNKNDSELNGKGECLLHPGRPVELIDEENYFFKFKSFEKQLLELYENNPNFVLPNFRLNEIKTFIKNGLEDFSISRLASKMPWGIPVPGDDSQVIYVWFDALVNYISTLGWGQTPSPSGHSPLAEGGESLFEKYWINGTPTQYCGKDNLRQQSAMWQAMLMACGLPCSHQIVVNGFITGDGGIKMSKSLGNVINPFDVVKEYGTDALRYFLLREVSSFEDSPFTLERFKDAYNGGLANGLGNLVSRIMTMAVNYGVKLSDEDLKMQYYTDPNKDLENFDINKFINKIWANFKNLDEYIQKNEPFKKIKVNREEAEKDVYYLLSQLYSNAQAISPLLPETSKKIQDLIKENKKPEAPLFLRKD